MRAVGSSLPRIDAVAKVTGAAIYAGDIDLPGQAWLKVVFAGVPHARITAIDVSAALEMPGVVAVLTAADVPVNEYGLIMLDQPVLCGPGSTPQAAIARWEADHVALVVAESEAAGRGRRQSSETRHMKRCPCSPIPLQRWRPARRRCTLTPSATPTANATHAPTCCWSIS
jgi:CO/xanthine dehydrogenase Mo-binding subunit